MAHFAEIDANNKVVRVLVVPDHQEDRGQDFLANDLGLGGTWLRTSYNTHAGVHANGGTPFRKNYAGIGMEYHADIDGFCPPQCHPIATLNATTGLWDCTDPSHTIIIQGA